MIRPGFWTGTTGMTTTTRFNGRTSADQVLAGHDLSARTVLVTGANGGIGFESARALAAAGQLISHHIGAALCRPAPQVSRGKK